MEKNYLSSTTASSQKLSKLDLQDSDTSSDKSTSSVYLETSPILKFQDLEIGEEIQRLISLISSTLSQANISISPVEDFDGDIRKSLNSLNYFVSTLCSEFLLKQKPKFPERLIDIEELKLANSKSKKFNEVGVTLIKKAEGEIMTRVFKMPKQGLMLTSEDCRDLSSLLIGAIRDSGTSDLRIQIIELQEKTVKYGKLLSITRAKLRKKEDQAEQLINYIKQIKAVNRKEEEMYILEMKKHSRETSSTQSEAVLSSNL